MLPYVRIENMASSRIVPVVLWGPTPPTHSITSILVGKDEKSIITGSKEGQLCLWDLVRDKGNEIQIFPCQLLYGHSSAITALADSANGPDNYALASATKCGQIFVWDLKDGTCLHARDIPGHHHAHIQVFQAPGRADLAPRLLVQGYYSELFVLDLSTFDILFQLRQKVSPSWITAVSVVENAVKQSMSFLGLNEDGYMKLWNMKASDLRATEPVDNDKQHFVGITSAVSLSTNPYGSAMALVVAQDSWQLFDISEGGFMQLCHVGSDTDSVALTGGAFVDRYQVLIWRSDNTASLYQLTRRCHTQVELKEGDGVGVEPAPPDAPEAAIHLCTFCVSSQRPAPQPAFTFSHLTNESPDGGRKQPCRLFLAGNSSGQIHAWFLPVQDHIMDLLCRYAVRHMHSPGRGGAVPPPPAPADALESLEPAATSELSDAWAAPAQPFGLVDFVGAKDALQLAAEASRGNNNNDNGGESGNSSRSPASVTASLFLRQQGKVVCGRADGSIVVVTATHAAAMHLLRATGKWRAGLPHLLLSGHSLAVTALLHPHSVDSARYEPDHLISGGEDFTVRLWDVAKGTLIFTLSLHGGVVRHLLCLPPSGAPRLQSCLCSVADDHSVALVSLKECRCLLLAAPHDFPIAGIRWRLADDFLLVACTNGTVYAWEIETGQLDRCVNGSVAVDVLSAAAEYHGSGVLDATGENSSAAITGLSSSYQFKGGSTSAPAAITSLSSSLTEISSSLLEVVGLRASRRDPFGHVLLFNCTQLINRLILEQKHNGSEYVWRGGGGLLADPKTEATGSDDRSVHRKASTASSTAASPGSADRRQSGPAPGSADYFRRYLGGRRALSAHTSSASANSRPQSTGSQTPVRAERPGSGHPPQSQSLSLTLKERSKAKRLIGETIATSRSEGKKETAQTRAASMPAQEVAHLLLSLLYTWGVSDLDKAASGNLGLVQPARPLSFGLVSRNGCLALLLPGWTFRNRYSAKTASPSSATLMTPTKSAAPAWTTVDSDLATSPDLPVERLPAVVPPPIRPPLVHWQVSSALSTQHLLCVVAVANTLMTLTEQHVSTPDTSSDQDDGSEDEDRSNTHLALVRAGWSQVAALHCVMLHDHLGPNYKPPLLTALARRWQDSCIEVRDAAQSLLQSELHRVGSAGRRKLIAEWLPLLPHSQASAGVLLRPGATKGSVSEDSRPATPSTPMVSLVDSSSSRSGDAAPGAGGGNSLRSSMDTVRQQAVAMVLLALICSEFTTDVAPTRSAKVATLPSRRASQQQRRGSSSGVPFSKTSSASSTLPLNRAAGEGLDGNVIQMTGKALEFMLLAPASARYPLNGATRRTAADLMGRGFGLWAVYVDTPAVIFSLLRLYGASSRRVTAVDGVPVSAVRSAQETRATLRAAHHALSLLAMSRPAEFISTIAKEVAAFSPSSSAVAQMIAEHRSASALEASAREQSLAALASPTTPTGSTGSTSSGVTLGGSGGGVEGDVLIKCHGKILNILELLLGKMTEDVILQLLEVVDIVLHCTDDDRLRQHGLAASFPALSKFNMVSFCASTCRLAVGARTGQMAIYDLRSPRCQVITAHTCPVTALCFSPDGRLLVTYSFGDSKISFWQMSGNLFGILSSGMRCIKSFPTDPAPPLPVLTQLKTFSLIWVNQRSVILLSNEKQQKFSV